MAPDSDMPTGSFEQVNVDMKKLNSVEPDYENMLILPTRNLVLFPGVNLSLGLGREVSMKVAEYAESHSVPIGILCQKDASVDDPKANDLYDFGVVADVIKVLTLPDGDKTVLLRGRGVFRVFSFQESSIIPGAISAVTESRRDSIPRKNNIEFAATVQKIVAVATDILNEVFDGHPPFTPSEKDNPVETVNTIATNIPLPVDEKARMLSTSRLQERALRLLTSLNAYKSRVEISQDIAQRTRSAMDQNQRNAFLQQQMETIREELYGDEQDDATGFEKRVSEVGLPEYVAKSVEKEIDKLRRLNPQSPDYSVQYSYLDTVLSLPWSAESEPNTDFNKAEETLENDHYGLEKVKERIIEQVAMIMDNPKGKSSILCLVGPPGVGKTSLGASVASALGRKYQRVALGGLHDEAEIRGHRRTYIGAMPGRIIDAIKKAGTRNPVLLLDEIDKIGADYKGDPAAALLEVLDPEQNCHFHDNYIDLDFDLSKVLFIATANTLQTVSRPLLDRIEIIEIPGYIVEEKLEIAKRHLLPNILKEQGLNKNALSFTDDAITGIIEDYTAESGVRTLEKQMAAILRKAVLARLRGKEFPLPVERPRLIDLLGLPPFRRDKCIEKAIPGVVTGLAWTQVGGEILLVEVSLSAAKSGGKLTLTGNLGDVMKESAAIAFEWVKAHAEVLGINMDMFEKFNIHIHFPEGAIPKDGPSAGITMATAIVSAFTNRPVRLKLAMSGEITLRGQVLPVGGIREKILAARRAGATDIILSEENRRDIDDINERYLTGLNIHYVETVGDVLDLAFGKQ